MQQVFIELYNYRPAWANCPESERTDFAKKVVEAVKDLKSAGLAASGWYDYFEQVNVSGDAQDFEAVLLGNARMARPASS